MVKNVEISKNSGNIFVFHDIVNAFCKGVIRFWNEFKITEKDKYNFYDIWEKLNKNLTGHFSHFDHTFTLVFF